MQDKIYVLPSKHPAEPGQASKHNLPAQLTPLIGREHEVAAACVLLRRPDVRLATLTGTGGIGKTRLVLQVATNLLADFTDGVYFVSLAPLSDPDLVIPTIAQTFELKETGKQSSLDLLKAYLKGQHLLLLLDNFEQVVTAAPLLVELLQTCPQLKVLVTSRTSLRVSGEHEFPVPPLAVPDLKHLAESESLSHYAAVDLFLQRAQALKSDFQVTATNARTIAEICVHLDGLPLALELAAARIKLLSPPALLARLSQRLQVLTSGTRDAPARQQTLRNTIDWSYNLLDAQEQRLFRLLSVFVGGCTLEAVESLCQALDDQTMDVLECLASLVDKSLIDQTEQEGEEEPRFAMLETIREYGLECLTASGESELTRQAHAGYYLRLAEEANAENETATGEEVSPQSPTEPEGWYDRLVRDHDNLRAALSWLHEQGETELLLRLANALQLFWFISGQWREGRNFLERALVGTVGARATARLEALGGLGTLTINLGDFDRAEEVYRESLALARELGEAGLIGSGLSNLGHIAMARGDYAAAHALYEESLALITQQGLRYMRWVVLKYLARVVAYQGDYVRARALAEEALILGREIGHRFTVAVALLHLGEVTFFQGDLTHAQALAEESLARLRELGDRNKFKLAEVLYVLGQIVLQQGDLAHAHTLAEESLQIYTKLEDKGGTIVVLSLLGKVTGAQGDYVAARTYYEQSFQAAREESAKWELACGLEGLATVVAAQGEPAWAARLWGTAETLRETGGVPLPPVYHAEYEQLVAAARTQLGEKTFATAWAEGRGMTLDQVLSAPAPTTMPKPTSTEPGSIPLVRKPPLDPDGLTAREVEVLRCVAGGLTDAQVAEQLVISPRTVNTHLKAIYGKIGVSSRSAATRYAMEHKLI